MKNLDLTLLKSERTVYPQSPFEPFRRKGIPRITWNVNTKTSRMGYINLSGNKLLQGFSHQQDAICNLQVSNNQIEIKIIQDYKMESQKILPFETFSFGYPFHTTGKHFKTVGLLISLSDVEFVVKYTKMYFDDNLRHRFCVLDF